jgi:hypothetical protein
MSCPPEPGYLNCSNQIGLIIHVVALEKKEKRKGGGEKKKKIHNLATTWRIVICFTPQLFHPHERTLVHSE